jgi:hypothetical protein
MLHDGSANGAKSQYIKERCCNFLLQKHSKPALSASLNFQRWRVVVQLGLIAWFPLALDSLRSAACRSEAWLLRAWLYVRSTFSMFEVFQNFFFCHFG